MNLVRYTWESSVRWKMQRAPGWESEDLVWSFSSATDIKYRLRKGANVPGDSIKLSAKWEGWNQSDCVLVTYSSKLWCYMNILFAKRSWERVVILYSILCGILSAVWEFSFTNLAVVTAWMVATATKIAIIATTHQVPTTCSSWGQVLIIYFISINVWILTTIL